MFLSSNLYILFLSLSKKVLEPLVLACYLKPPSVNKKTHISWGESSPHSRPQHTTCSDWLSWKICHNSTANRHQAEASLAVTHTWQLGKLCGRTCYVTKPVTGEFICDMWQLEIIEIKLEQVVSFSCNPYKTSSPHYILYTEAFPISQYNQVWNIKYEETHFQLPVVTWQLSLFL